MPHNADGKNGKHTLLIPPGARSPKRVAAVTAPVPALAHVDVLQAHSESAQNCVVGSIANCINAVAMDPALAVLMQAEIDTTEGQRRALKKCGQKVREMSAYTCKSQGMPSVLRDSAVRAEDIGLAFFLSNDPAAFGTFVIRVTDADGGKDHTLALIRHDQQDAYVIDSNPKFGNFAHPFTTAALLAIDVVDINFAVKIELL